MSCNTSLPVLILPQTPEAPIVRGDTWKGLSIEILVGPVISAVPLDITGSLIRLNMVAKDKRSSHLLSSATGDITITDGVNGLLTIDAISRLDWNVGCYVGDLEITLADNTRTTYCVVEMTIIDDITK